MNVIVPPSYPQYLGMSEVSQWDFQFNDETKAVAFLKHNPCPLCNRVPALWRICSPGERPTFQVRCTSYGKRGCKQAPVPDPPIEDSRGAVRAWSLACKLAQ